MAAQLTKEEASIYDRGIRLWGASAQSKLRASRVALVGISALGAEIAKNVALAGASLTILDDAPVTARDLDAHLFLNPRDENLIGKRRSEACAGKVRGVNSLVKVETCSGSVGEQTDDWLRSHALVCACSQPALVLDALSRRCRAVGVPLIAVGVLGARAWLVSDLGVAFPAQQPEQQAANPAKRARAAEGQEAKPAAVLPFVPVHEALEASVAALAKAGAHPALLCAAALHQHAVHAKDGQSVEGFFGSLLNTAGATVPVADILEAKRLEGVELAAVCAVVAGFASQEAIKSLTRGCEAAPGNRTPPPIVNAFGYDCRSCAGDTFMMSS